MGGSLSADLKRMGYEPTDKDSPFDEDGSLWSNGVELVCDETAIVIDSASSSSSSSADDGGDYNSGDRDYFRYPNSEKIRMIGGFFGNYFEDDGLY